MFRRFSSGLVSIETKNDLGNEALQNSSLMLGKGGALRRDHIFDAGFKQRDQIELAFAHDRAVCFNQRPFGFMEFKNVASFLQECGLWLVVLVRIDMFSV